MARGETLDKYIFGRMKRNLKFKLILGVYEGMLLSSVFVVSLFSEEGLWMNYGFMHKIRPSLTYYLLEPKYPKLFQEESFGGVVSNH